LNGFNSSGPWTLAGSFVANGNNNITSGSVDGNSIAAQPFTVAMSGTYCINSSGLHTMTVQGSSWGPVTFAFVLNSDGNGRIIEYDDTTGQGSHGSGELRKANSSAFSLGALNGSWVFGLTGWALHPGNTVESFVDIGQFALANGSMTGGTCDSNDGGSFKTCTFSGNVSSIDPQTGRGTVTVQSSNGASHEAIYVVSAYELVMAGTDSVPNTQVPMQTGLVSQQNGPFNLGSLNGNEVIAMEGIHGSDGLDQSIAGIATLDGQGHFTVTAMDEDLNGDITQDPQQQGTYKVQSNGAFALDCQGGGCPIGYLWTQNKGVMIGTGNSIIFGQLGPQSGGPFSNASLSGTYYGGSSAPLDYVNSPNEVGVVSFNGAGSGNDSGLSSGSGGLDQWFNSPLTCRIASNGRGTGADGVVLYVGSPSFFIVLSNKAGAELGLYQK
jgi:hypothetical protein